MPLKVTKRRGGPAIIESDDEGSDITCENEPVRRSEPRLSHRPSFRLYLESDEEQSSETTSANAVDAQPKDNRGNNARFEALALIQQSLAKLHGWLSPDNLPYVRQFLANADPADIVVNEISLGSLPGLLSQPSTPSVDRVVSSGDDDVQQLADRLQQTRLSPDHRTGLSNVLDDDGRAPAQGSLWCSPANVSTDSPAALPRKSKRRVIDDDDDEEEEEEAEIAAAGKTPLDEAARSPAAGVLSAWSASAHSPAASQFTLTLEDDVDDDAPDAAADPDSDRPASVGFPLPQNLGRPSPIAPDFALTLESDDELGADSGDAQHDSRPPSVATAPRASERPRQSSIAPDFALTLESDDDIEMDAAAAAAEATVVTRPVIDIGESAVDVEAMVGDFANDLSKSWQETTVDEERGPDAERQPPSRVAAAEDGEADAVSNAEDDGFEPADAQADAASDADTDADSIASDDTAASSDYETNVILTQLGIADEADADGARAPGEDPTDTVADSADSADDAQSFDDATPAETDAPAAGVATRDVGGEEVAEAVAVNIRTASVRLSTVIPPAADCSATYEPTAESPAVAVARKTKRRVILDSDDEQDEKSALKAGDDAAVICEGETEDQLDDLSSGLAATRISSRRDSDAVASDRQSSASEASIASLPRDSFESAPDRQSSSSSDHFDLSPVPAPPPASASQHQHPDDSDDEPVVRKKASKKKPITDDDEEAAADGDQASDQNRAKQEPIVSDSDGDSQKQIRQPTKTEPFRRPAPKRDAIVIDSESESESASPSESESESESESSSDSASSESGSESSSESESESESEDDSSPKKSTAKRSAWRSSSEEVIDSTPVYVGPAWRKPASTTRRLAPTFFDLIDDADTPDAGSDSRRPPKSGSRSVLKDSGVANVTPLVARPGPPGKDAFKTPATVPKPVRTPASRIAVGPATPQEKRAFKQTREALAKSLFDEFNRVIFKNQLLPDQIELSWNPRYNTRAGNTKCFHRGNKPTKAHIELSTKVIDTEGKLRNTLVHEMCHAAQHLVDDAIKRAHGPEFQAWGRRAMKCYADLDVKTCHNYDIDYKFNYKCSSCSYMVGRHSASLDNKPCKWCGAAMERVPVLKKDGTPRTPHKKSAYQEFVAQHYSAVRKMMPLVPNGEVMRVLAERWKQTKPQAAAGSADSGSNDGATFSSSDFAARAVDYTI